MQDLLPPPVTESPPANPEPRVPMQRLLRPSALNQGRPAVSPQPSRSWSRLCGAVLRGLFVVALLAAAIGLAVFGFVPILIVVGALLLPAVMPLLGVGLGVLAADELEPARGEEIYQI